MQDKALEDLWSWLDSVIAQAGLPEPDAQDAAANARAKVIEVLGEFQARRRSRPRKLEPYLKQVCRNALVDWVRARQARSAGPVSANERSLIDNFMYSAHAEEGDEERGGFHATRAPSTRRTRRKPRPFLIRLIRRYERNVWAFEFDIDAPTRAFYDINRNPSAAINETEETLRKLPDRTRQAARLYLRYWREADIARQLGISRPAVSKLLERMRQTWGWDHRNVEHERLRLLWANLLVVVRDALKPFRLEDDESEGDEALAGSDWPSEPPRRSWFEEMQSFLGQQAAVRDAGSGARPDGLKARLAKGTRGGRV